MVTSRPRIGLLCVVVAAVVALFVTAGTAAAATGKIEGEVVDSVTEAGIEAAEVCALDPVEFEFVACEMTDPDGEYALGGLPNGSYVVEFRAMNLGYVRQYFNGVASFEDADEVVVAGGGTVSGVDAELEEGGEIAGRVTDATTGAGIEEVEVCAFTLSVFGGCALTNSSGNYTIQGVASGSWVVEFWAEFLGYETRYYNEVANFNDANLVSVFAPSTAIGINARLSKPGSHVVTRTPVSTPVISVPPPPAVKPKPAPHCRKAFKRVKRHGHAVCVRKHKKKHRS
jgi:Carboxypeptidase regulatory-like domain